MSKGHQTEHKKRMGKRRKKRKIQETAEKRFNRVTKDYDECKKRNIWKIERKVADELLDASKQLDLELQLDRLAEFCYNSFPISILLQLRRKDVYESLDQDMKDLADKMDHYLLRRKIVDYIQKVDHPEVEEFKEEYKAKWEEKRSWEDYWQGQLKPVTSLYWFKQATAWYLKLDIRIVAIEEDNPKFPFCTYVFDGLFENTSSNEEECKRNKKIGPLYVGYKTDLQHQSLIPKEKQDKIDEKEVNVNSTVTDHEVPGSSQTGNKNQLIECPNCKCKFTSLVKHVAAKRSKCNGKVDEELLNAMRKEAKLRNKEMNKIHKAQSRKKKHAIETYDQRKDRLAMQSYYMAKHRTRLREADYELTKKIARESKDKSRKKQTLFDPLYERTTDDKRQ